MISHPNQTFLHLNPKNQKSEQENDFTMNKLLISKTNIASNETANNNLLPNINNHSIKLSNANSNINNFNNLNNLDNLDNNKNNIIKEFSLPQQIITELENPNLCVICFDSDISRDPAVKFKCSHVFCLNCVKNYLEKNIENGKVNIILIRF